MVSWGYFLKPSNILYLSYYTYEYRLLLFSISQTCFENKKILCHRDRQGKHQKEILVAITGLDQSKNWGSLNLAHYLQTCRCLTCMFNLPTFYLWREKFAVFAWLFYSKMATVLWSGLGTCTVYLFIFFVASCCYSAYSRISRGNLRTTFVTDFPKTWSVERWI